jgi:predicted enzyme related to lactoylglutathione lyase
MGNPVMHFEVIGKDAQALKTFYRDAFDWDMGPVMGPMDYSVVDTKAKAGIGGGIGGGPDAGGHVTFYVSVADIEAALSKIESLGGKKLMGPEQVPGGPVIAMFSDPEGHAIGLVQPE